LGKYFIPIWKDWDKNKKKYFIPIFSNWDKKKYFIPIWKDWDKNFSPNINFYNLFPLLFCRIVALICRLFLFIFIYFY